MGWPEQRAKLPWLRLPHIALLEDELVGWLARYLAAVLRVLTAYTFLITAINYLLARVSYLFGSPCL